MGGPFTLVPVPPLVPETFRRAVAGRPPDRPGDPSGDAWLDRLPQLIRDRLDAWDLAVEGPAWHGVCALVLPVVRADGERAALKLTWPHREAATEHLALRLWNGDGAVRLLAAEPAQFALLLERLDGDRDLERVGILEACEELGALFGRLDRPATPQIPSLADEVPRWRDLLYRPVPRVPRRLLQQARSHLDDLAPGLAGAAGGRLVHSDLHFMNALAPLDPTRGSWLAIDPKTVAGEWAYAVAPAIWNREDLTARAHSASAHVRLRADLITDAAGLDEDRVRMWTFLRLVLNAVDAAADDEEWTAFGSRLIPLAKAFAAP